MMDRISDKMLENMKDILSAYEQDLPWLSALSELKERRESEHAGNSEELAVKK
jgi:hypothetical protein